MMFKKKSRVVSEQPISASTVVTVAERIDQVNTSTYDFLNNYIQNTYLHIINVWTWLWTLAMHLPARHPSFCSSSAVQFLSPIGSAMK